MKKNVGGRPPVPGDKREKLVPCYLTRSTAEKLRKFAEFGGFKGTSTLLTAIVEPIIDGGLSVQAAARSLNRVQKFMEKNGSPFGVSWKILKEAGRDLFAPPPPIPDDVEDLSKLKADLRALLAELENQTTTNTSK
jgi:hypothetical protein